ASESFLSMISLKARSLFGNESDPGRCEVLSGMLFDSAMDLVRMGSYPSAALILGDITRRKEDAALSDSADKDAMVAAMDKELPPDVIQLLTADAVGHDLEKQGHAVQLLASIGADATSAFTSIIRSSEDLRARQLAASYITRSGPEAIAAFKEGFLADANAFERSRMLEVLDTVTRDVRDELALMLADENPKVRGAAFALAERVNTPDARKLVLEHAQHKNPDVADSAIRSIGRMKEPLAVPVLSDILRSSKEQAVLVSASRAIGQIRDNSGVEVLGALLKPKGFWFFKKWKPTEVRLAAALALRAIGSPQAIAALAVAEKDPDVRVRDTAKKAMASSKEPPPA
ncbi:MAG: HEAT repeat domain-containing protein, partial [Thermodesulfobacteriota bacterium]